MHGKISFKHMLFSWKIRGYVLEILISLLCHVIVNLNNKILKEGQAKFYIYIYIFYNYSFIFAPA